METFQTLFARKVSDALAAAGFSEAGEVTAASNPRFGDYQTNAALVLAKERGENPRAIAKKITEHLNVSHVSELPKIEGAGFINFTLRSDVVANRVTDLLQDERLGVDRVASRGVSSSISDRHVAKRCMSVTSAAWIGDALARVATFLVTKLFATSPSATGAHKFGMVIMAGKLPRQRGGWRAIRSLNGSSYKKANELHPPTHGLREGRREELVKLQAG